MNGLLAVDIDDDVHGETCMQVDGRMAKGVGRSVVSYDEDVRKLIHQTAQIRCLCTRFHALNDGCDENADVVGHDRWL